MSLNNVLIKVLASSQQALNSNEITKIILKDKLFTFNGATPELTVSANLGNFIRKGNNMVDRVKRDDNKYYYFIKDKNIELSTIDNNINTEIKAKKSSGFSERDLHLLLTTYLKASNIYSKTIFHEKSNGKDNSQIWIHPDIVGIKFLKLESHKTQSFIETVNKIQTFKLYAYELKKDIGNDNDLKKAYFQALSNSSWANYGYLVAFDINKSLYEEIERLNELYGIGVILLNGNPYNTQILFQAKYRELDFKTIDKLCVINNEFEEFIEKSENLINVDKKNKTLVRDIEGGFEKFCDNFLENEESIKEYCDKCNILL